MILRCPYYYCAHNSGDTVNGYCQYEGEVVLEPSEIDNDLLDCKCFKGVL